MLHNVPCFLEPPSLTLTQTGAAMRWFAESKVRAESLELYPTNLTFSELAHRFTLPIPPHSTAHARSRIHSGAPNEPALTHINWTHAPSRSSTPMGLAFPKSRMQASTPVT